MSDIETVPCRHCTLCGRAGTLLFERLSDRLFAAPGEWCLRHCTNPECGLYWLDPQPLEAHVGKLYEQYFTHEGSSNTSKIALKVRTRPHMKHLVRDMLLAHCFGYSEMLATMSPRAQRVARALGGTFGLSKNMRLQAGAHVMWLDASVRGRLLDVGCGNGRLVRIMSGLGWDGCGVDPDSKAVAVARKQGLTVFEGTLEEVGFANESFNAVTMMHVIEHLPNFMRTLRVTFSLLKPGGRLVLRTPNVNSRGCRHFGRHWQGWDPPRHLFLFSGRTLSDALRRAGFKVGRIGTLPNMTHEIWEVSRAIRRQDRPNSVHRVTPSTFDRYTAKCIAPLARPLGAVGWPGEELFAIAVKE